jgi:hypothetical protein
MKLLSLTDPVEYANRRSAAMAEVKNATVAAYTAAFKQQIKAGASKDHAKEEATKIAIKTKEMQERAMAIRFPDSDTKTYMNKAYKEADKFI